MVPISAKHLSAPEVILVPIGAKPYRVALISTKPAPDFKRVFKPPFTGAHHG